MKTIETTGAELREITGWTGIDFVLDDDRVVIQYGHHGEREAYAMWTDPTGVSRELGLLTATAHDALAYQRSHRW
jgi:hypothetical protein